MSVSRWTQKDRFPIHPMSFNIFVFCNGKHVTYISKSLLFYTMKNTAKAIHVLASVLSGSCKTKKKYSWLSYLLLCQFCRAFDLFCTETQHDTADIPFHVTHFGLGWVQWHFESILFVLWWSVAPAVFLGVITSTNPILYNRMQTSLLKTQVESTPFLQKRV